MTLLSHCTSVLPVILKDEDYETWLTGTPADAAKLLKPYPAGEMETRFVSKKVNRTNYDGPDLVEDVG
jgi:putative SOS response-associated peptidase YedK